MVCIILILLLHCTQHSVAVYLPVIHRVIDLHCYKGICALLHIISNDMQNVNRILALHSALRGSVLYSNSINIVRFQCHDKTICALLLIISNVVLNINLIVKFVVALSTL